MYEPSIVIIGIDETHREALIAEYNLPSESSMNDCMVAFTKVFNDKMVKHSLDTVKLLRVQYNQSDYINAVISDGRNKYENISTAMVAEFEVSDDILFEMNAALKLEYKSRI